jgi:integrase
VAAAPEPRRRRRRKADATGSLRIAWRAKGPMWLMKFRLPDGTESQTILGPAWVKRNPEDAKGWLPRRGRPPESVLTEDAARSALRAFLDQQTNRTPPERVTVERCVDAFLADCEERGRSPNTLRTYRQIAAEVKARWEGWRVVDVDYDELEDYRDELAARGLAGSTLNQRRAVLSGIFRRARRDFRVNVDPMDGFERADVKDSGDLDVYSVEEVWALVRAAGSGVHHTGQRAYKRRSKSGRDVEIAARRFTVDELAARKLQDLYDAAIIVCAALCGLRRSEILGLRWRAVLWDQRAILVRRSFTQAGGDRLPKGQRVHSVPAAQQVLDFLRRVQDTQHDPQPDDRVFAGPEGGAMDGSALYRRYREFQKAAGVRPLRFHDLRHTFGTQAVATPGVHINDVKEWMGHRQLSTTMRYVHHRPRHEAAAALERHFTGSISELDALLGEPGDFRIGPSEDDYGRPD